MARIRMATGTMAAPRRRIIVVPESLCVMRIRGVAMKMTRRRRLPMMTPR